MQQHPLITLAAPPAVAVIRNIKADQLELPTPCSEYNVRGLIKHLLFWGPPLEGAARKESVAPPAASEQDVDLGEDDWADKVAEQIDRLVSAWSEPDAWQGSSQMGPMQMPAPAIGGMVLSELIVHAWDLARATGQHPTWDDEVIQLLLQSVSKSADTGREMGVYGERIQVSDTAPTLDQVLGLTGRDPHWTP